MEVKCYVLDDRLGSRGVNRSWVKKLTKNSMKIVWGGSKL